MKLGHNHSQSIMVMLETVKIAMMVGIMHSRKTTKKKIAVEARKKRYHIHQKIKRPLKAHQVVWEVIIATK